MILKSAVIMSPPWRLDAYKIFNTFIFLFQIFEKRRYGIMVDIKYIKIALKYCTIDGL